MKKIIIVLCLFLCLFSNNVLADSNVYYDTESTEFISYEDDVLSLNNYVHDSGDYVYQIDDFESYAIYTEEDLTIDLTGENRVLSEGIYVGGNLIITGTGSLETDYLYVGGNLLTTTCVIKINGGSDYFEGPKILRPMHVAYIDESSNEMMAQYVPSWGTYYDYLCEDVVDNIIIYPTTQFANVDNLYTDSNVFIEDNEGGSDIELENVDGFIIFNPDITSKVEYDADSLTYTVEFIEDFSIETNKIHSFELVYKSSEWNKDVAYKVLDCKNSYVMQTDAEGNLNWVEAVKDETYYQPTGYVGEGTRYSSTSGGVKDIGSAFLEIKVSKDNYISLEVLGNDGTHKYINIKVLDINDSKEEEPESPHWPKHFPIIIPSDKKEDRPYIVPNTGIR